MRAKIKWLVNYVYLLFVTSDYTKYTFEIRHPRIFWAGVFAVMSITILNIKDETAELSKSYRPLAETWEFSKQLANNGNSRGINLKNQDEMMESGTKRGVRNPN